MAKFKPFTVLNVTRVMVMDCEVGEYDPSWYNAISDRRHGIEVHVTPHKKCDKIVWKWSAYQAGAKHISSGGYKFTNWSRQWKEGTSDTFEEGQKIVTDLYTKWMNERPTA